MEKFNYAKVIDIIERFGIPREHIGGLENMDTTGILTGASGNENGISKLSGLVVPVGYDWRYSILHWEISYIPLEKDAPKRTRMYYYKERERFP